MSVKFPFSVKVGNVAVKIYKCRNKGYAEYRFYDRHPDGRRKNRPFASFEDAKQEAELLVRKLANGEGDVLSLSSSDRVSYLRAISILKSTGVSLEMAAEQFAEAHKALKGVASVTEAVKYYVRKHSHAVVRKTVREVADELIESKRGLRRSERYLEDLTHRCGRLAEGFSCQISDVTSRDLEAFLSGLKLSARSHNNFRGVIITLWRFAKKRGYLPKDNDECEAIERVKDKSGAIAIFTPEEIDSLLQNAQPHVVPFLAIGAFAGLRSMEIARLDWSDVRLGVAEPHIVVQAAHSKTASRRIVPISENLIAWLQSFSRKSGRVWPLGHNYIYPCISEQNALARQEKRQVVPWKKNALRHSYISYRLAKIKDVAEVALEAGNSARVIFTNYRELVTGAQAEKWFKIVPQPKVERGKLIPLPQAA